LPAPTPAERKSVASIAGHSKWARTVDRHAATAPARAAGPNGIEWHLARLGPEFVNATERQRLDAAESARRAYFKRMAWQREANKRTAESKSRKKAAPPGAA
jgi:hypothetical protein